MTTSLVLLLSLGFGACLPNLEMLQTDVNVSAEEEVAVGQMVRYGNGRCQSSEGDLAGCDFVMNSPQECNSFCSTWGACTGAEFYSDRKRCIAWTRNYVDYQPAGLRTVYGCWVADGSRNGREISTLRTEIDTVCYVKQVSNFLPAENGKYCDGTKGVQADWNWVDANQCKLNCDVNPACLGYSTTPGNCRWCLSGYRLGTMSSWTTYMKGAVAAPAACVRTTEAGETCKTSFEYGGTTYNDCTTEHHDRAWCYTENDAGRRRRRWRECRPCYSQCKRCSCSDWDEHTRMYSNCHAADPCTSGFCAFCHVDGITPMDGPWDTHASQCETMSAPIPARLIGCTSDSVPGQYTPGSMHWNREGGLYLTDRGADDCFRRCKLRGYRYGGLWKESSRYGGCRCSHVVSATNQGGCESHSPGLVTGGAGTNKLAVYELQMQCNPHGRMVDGSGGNVEWLLLRQAGITMQAEDFMELRQVACRGACTTSNHISEWCEIQVPARYSGFASALAGAWGNCQPCMDEAVPMQYYNLGTGCAVAEEDPGIVLFSHHNSEPTQSGLPGIQMCYAAVMENDGCAKDYFTYIFTIKRCTCKAAGHLREARRLKILRGGNCRYANIFKIGIPYQHAGVAQATPYKNLPRAQGKGLRQCYLAAQLDSSCSQKYFNYHPQTGACSCHDRSSGGRMHVYHDNTERLSRFNTHSYYKMESTHHYTCIDFYEQVMCRASGCTWTPGTTPGQGTCDETSEENMFANVGPVSRTEWTTACDDMIPIEFRLVFKKLAGFEIKQCKTAEGILSTDPKTCEIRAAAPVGRLLESPGAASRFSTSVSGAIRFGCPECFKCAPVGGRVAGTRTFTIFDEDVGALKIKASAAMTVTIGLDVEGDFISVFLGVGASVAVSVTVMGAGIGLSIELEGRVRVSGINAKKLALDILDEPSGSHAHNVAISLECYITISVEVLWDTVEVRLRMDKDGEWAVG